MTPNSASEVSERKNRDIWLRLSRFLCFLMKIGSFKGKNWCLHTIKQEFCVLRTDSLHTAYRLNTPWILRTKKGGGVTLFPLFERYDLTYVLLMQDTDSFTSVKSGTRCPFFCAQTLAHSVRTNKLFPRILKGMSERLRQNAHITSTYCVRWKRPLFHMSVSESFSVSSVRKSLTRTPYLVYMYP